MMRPNLRFLHVSNCLLALLCACAILGSASSSAMGQEFFTKSRLNGGSVAPNDQMGFSVSYDAAIDRAAVGAPLHDESGSVLDTGKILLFQRTNGQWSLEDEFEPTDATGLDRFGSSVSISNQYAAAGAPRHSSVFPDGGAVYIYKRNLIDWSLFDKVRPVDVQQGDWFGAAVALKDNLLVVGAPREDSGGVDSGSVYVFERQGLEFVEVQRILNPEAGTRAGDLFGSAVAIVDDRIVIGAPDADPIQRGAVHVYIKNAQWIRETTLQPTDLPENARFGTSVGGDTNTEIVVGAPLADFGGDQGNGAAYLYRRSLNKWTEDEKIGASEVSGDSFGFSVDLSGDRLVCAAPQENDGSTFGVVYAFVRDGATWSTPIRLGASDFGAGQSFGYSVSLDGESFVSGARFDDSVGQNAGAAWEFEIRDCRHGAVNKGAGAVADVLFVNGAIGNADERLVEVDATGSMVATISRPPAGGNGKYFIHANSGQPTDGTLSALPAKLGSSCFEVLLSGGATPLAVFNAIGKEQKVGASAYFDGSPLTDPPSAPALFLNLPNGDTTNLPPGTVVTFGGAIIDPGTVSSKGASLTNSVTVRFL